MAFCMQAAAGAAGPRAPLSARATVLRAVDDRAEDEALMTAVAVNADKDAFARVFGRYAPRVKAHLIARGAPAGVADELTQEVMLVVWRKAALFDARKGSLVTWLYTISRNTLLNHVRAAGRREGDRGVDVDFDVPADAPATGEQQLIDMERRRGLAASVERLPPEQREILHRAYWKGQTLQECADEIQIPLGTVKTRVRLALARLRELLGGRSDE
jgi:RNA polymerase sigma-70 factor (ECF subfamily)